MNLTRRFPDERLVMGAVGVNGPRRAARYTDTGVDEASEQSVFRRAMLPLLAATKTAAGYAQSLSGISLGHFATVLQLHGSTKIAVSTDGVGTKILIARMAKRYDTIGIDCVANNVNDLLCLGADPLVLLDYIAINRIDERVLGQVALGLARGADEAGVSIPGGEIAQVADLLAPAADTDEPMLDLVGTAIGGFPSEGDELGPRDLLEGDAVSPGDVILGFPSSGLHSNGYSLARSVLFGQAGLTVEDPMPGTSQTIGDALLEPTRIYVGAVRDLWKAHVDLHGLVHISGGGLLNLTRLPAPVGYVIDRLPEAPPIFSLIQETGALPDIEMFATLNMGVGLCVIVPSSHRDRALAAGAAHGLSVLGYVTGEGKRMVRIVERGLVGTGDAFSLEAR